MVRHACSMLDWWICWWEKMRRFLKTFVRSGRWIIARESWRCCCLCKCFMSADEYSERLTSFVPWLGSVWYCAGGDRGWGRSIPLAASPLPAGTCCIIGMWPTASSASAAATAALGLWAGKNKWVIRHSTVAAFPCCGAGGLWVHEVCGYHSSDCVTTSESYILIG